MATNFPVTLAGTYTDGSLCKASDYATDLGSLKDAVNHLFERYSSFSFSGEFSERQGPKGAGRNETGATGAYNIMGSNTAKHVFSAFYVPTWMQGIRVRSFHVLNCSVHSGLLSNIDATKAGLTFGVSYSTNYDNFHPTGWSSPTEVAAVTFNTLPELLGYSQIQTGVTGAIDANGHVLQTAGADVVAPGNWIVFWASGEIAFDNQDFHLTEYSHWRFSANILCDTMVPIP